jgi:hypothetical protein
MAIILMGVRPASRGPLLSSGIVGILTENGVSQAP